MGKITLDSISRGDLHKLVLDLEKRVDDLEDSRSYDYENTDGEPVDIVPRLVEVAEELDDRLDELEAKVDKWIVDESVDERAFKKMLFKVVAQVSGIAKNRHALVAFAEVMERNSDKDVGEYAKLLKKVYPEIRQDIAEGVYDE